MAVQDPDFSVFALVGSRIDVTAANQLEYI